MDLLIVNNAVVWAFRGYNYIRSALMKDLWASWIWASEGISWCLLDRLIHSHLAQSQHQANRYFHWFTWATGSPAATKLGLCNSLVFWKTWKVQHTCMERDERFNQLHWGWDKMAAIFQTTVSNGFSWMKMYEFWLKFHWSLFLRVQLTIFLPWFR